MKPLKPEDPINRLISDQPEMYILSCALCPFGTARKLKREIKEARDEHEAATGHNISYTRHPMLRRKR